MKSYRKKPVIIQAVQFTPELNEAFWESEDAGEVHPFLKALPAGVSILEREDGFRLQTPEDRYTLRFGDWIAKGTKGEYYPIPGDVFPTIYDEVV